MRAVIWQGAKDIRVEHVPDPKLEADTDIVIRVTSTGLCGSDLHLYEVLAPFMEPGDIVGHEPMGVVEEVGAAVRHLDIGDRVVDPVQRVVRPLLDVRARPAEPVRDHPEHRARHRREPARLQQALRSGPGRPGRVPAGPARRLRRDQGAQRPAGRPVPVPQRRAAYRVAGGGVRRRSRGRDAAGARGRADRRHGRPDRHAPRAPGPGRRTSCRSGCSAWPTAARRPSTSPGSTAPRWRTSCATRPRAAAPTR